MYADRIDTPRARSGEDAISPMTDQGLAGLRSTFVLGETVELERRTKSMQAWSKKFLPCRAIGVHFSVNIWNVNHWVSMHFYSVLALPHMP